MVDDGKLEGGVECGVAVSGRGVRGQRGGAGMKDELPQKNAQNTKEGLLTADKAG